MTKKDFPEMVNLTLEEGLNRQARGIVKGFQTEIYPLLLQFGLFDDKHIEKYLSCETVEDIYKDALEVAPQEISKMKQKELVEELKENPKEREDVWQIFRGSRSEAKSPEEEGFVWKPIPGADFRNRKALLNALSVKDMKISINEAYLTEVSVVRPTAEQKELYNMVLEFCEAYNKNGYHKKHNIGSLFASNLKGIYPSANSILGIQWLRKKV